MIRRSFLGSLVAGVCSFFCGKKEWDYYSIAFGDRGLVYDANGKEINHVIHCYLSSGMVYGLVTDNNNRFVEEADGSELMKRWQKYPAPLVFVPKTPDELTVLNKSFKRPSGFVPYNWAVWF